MMTVHHLLNLFQLLGSETGVEGFKRRWHVGTDAEAVAPITHPGRLVALQALRVVS